MPLKECSVDGESGWRWGDAGTCYTGPQARQRALRQAAAIRASGYTGNERRPTQDDLDAPAVGSRVNPLALDPTRTTLLRVTGPEGTGASVTTVGPPANTARPATAVAVIPANTAQPTR